MPGGQMLYLVDDGLSWDRALKEFADYQYSGRLSEKTIQNREECLRLLARACGKLPLEVDLHDMQAQLSRSHPRTGKRLAEGTMRSERSYFQTFYSWLVDEGYLEKSPAARLRRIKSTRRQARPFRMEQVDAMLDSGAYTRTRDIITLCALTGLRIGEVVKIRGEDVDWEGMVLTTIRKGNLNHRIAVPESLRPLTDRYPHEGWWFPSTYTNKLFPNGGGHILMKSASARVGAAIRRAGITDRKLTGHSLRHYIATTMLHEGVPIRVVQETLGHASIATTQIYTEVTEEELRDGINVVPAIEFRAHASRRGRIAA